MPTNWDITNSSMAARIEELNAGRFQEDKDRDEFLADMFAAFLLMSQGSVRRAFKDREIQPKGVEPMQVFRLACYFGVGYGTLIDHMALTLKLLGPQQRESLLQTQPKETESAIRGFTPIRCYFG